MSPTTIDVNVRIKGVAMTATPPLCKVELMFAHGDIKEVLAFADELPEQTAALIMAGTICCVTLIKRDFTEINQRLKTNYQTSYCISNIAYG